MLQPGDHVLVALSGGPDSVATLAALDLLRARLGVTLSAMHVHHGLRGAEADRDAQFAESLAGRLGVPFVIDELAPGLAEGGNVEARARHLRYAALLGKAEELGADRVATGHTRDDQAETVLLRIVQGCGPAGLAGILPVREGGRVIRPLLGCTRVEIESFLAALQLPHCNDSSNRSRRHFRNRIRHDLLPQLRQLNPRIDRALANLACLTRARERLRPASLRSPGRELSVAELLACPPELRSEQIHSWLSHERRRGLRFGKRHVEAIVSLLGDGRPNRRVALPGGWVLREYDRLRFASAIAVAQRGPMVLELGQRVALNGWSIEASEVQGCGLDRRLPPDLWTAVLDASRLPEMLVRNPRAGDRVQPHGMRGHRKLADVFVDRRVPKALRASCPVVESGSEVVWVPGVVRGTVGLVGAHTRQVVWLTARNELRPLLG
jgi:tRNA(Ile)-lysidine synthase